MRCQFPVDRVHVSTVLALFATEPCGGVLHIDPDEKVKTPRGAHMAHIYQLWLLTQHPPSIIDSQVLDLDLTDGTRRPI